MIFAILGEHTAPYGDPPYEKFKEFERALQSAWPAICGFYPNSVSAANVHIRAAAVADMPVREILARLAETVRVAAQEAEWEIWTVAEEP